MLNGFPDNFRMGDDDVLNEFRQKQANFDLEEKRNEINNSRSLFVGAIAGLTMAAVVGWFVLAPQYENTTEAEIPVIRRPQEQVKVPPVGPGGVEISNQEKTVYDIIERKPDNTDQVNVLPPAEQPNADAIEALVEEVAPIAAPVEETPVIKAESLNTPKVTETTVPAEAETAQPATEPVKSTTAFREPVTPPAPVKAEAAQPKPAETAAAKPGNAKTNIANGAWQIQLMSSPNRAAVEKSWKTMSSKYKVLKDLPYEVSSADLGKKGTYYRLKAGNFATKEEATALCNKLKAAGGSCFTARK